VIGSVLVRIIEDFSMGKISKEKMYKNLNNFEDSSSINSASYSTLI